MIESKITVLKRSFKKLYLEAAKLRKISKHPLAPKLRFKTFKLLDSPIIKWPDDTSLFFVSYGYNEKFRVRSYYLFGTELESLAKELSSVQVREVRKNTWKPIHWCEKRIKGLKKAIGENLNQIDRRDEKKLQSHLVSILLEDLI